MRKVLLVILALFLFSSCAERKEEGNIFHVAITQEIPNLDIQGSSSRSTRDALLPAYDTPFVLSDDGSVTPLLVSAYSVEGDTLEMKISSGILFHDGSVMTPRDVKDSLNRWLSLNKNISDALDGARFRVDGESILIGPVRGAGNIPYLMAVSPDPPVVMPSKVIGELEDEHLPVTKVIGTGMYELESFVPGKSVELVRSEHQNFDRKPAFDSLLFESVPSPSMRRLGLESGRYDLISEVLPEDVPAFRENDKVKLHELSESESLVVVYNKESGVMSNEWMRKAFSLSLDREGILYSVFGPYGTTLDTSYMGMGDFYNGEDPYGRRDLEEAEKILEENGYSGESVRILVPDMMNMEDGAYTIKRNLEEAGINAEVMVRDWVSFLSLRSSSDSYDVFLSAYESVPLPLLRQYLVPGYPGGFDDGGYLEKLYSAEDEESLKEVWKDAEKYFFSTIPFSVIGHYGTIYASSVDIDGLDFSSGRIDFSSIRRI